MKLYIKADTDLDTKIQEFNALSNLGTIDEILAELNTSLVEYKLVDINKRTRFNSSNYYTARFKIDKLNARDFSFYIDEHYSSYGSITSITYDRYGYTIDGLHIPASVFVNSSDSSINSYNKKYVNEIHEDIVKLKSVNRYKFILNNIKSEVEKLPGITLDVESTNLDYDKIPEATFKLYIDGNLYIDGRGHSILKLADDIFLHDDIKLFVNKVKGYINKYKKSGPTKLGMSELASTAPEDIKFAARRFVYWISNERCKGAQDLDTAYDNVYNRTINNKLCGMYQSGWSESQLKLLFDYAKQNKLSVSDLIKFCRYA